MRISFNWLKKYIHVPDSAETISEILTSLGLEVEGMEKIGRDADMLRGVMTGQVVECRKHPGADRLMLTKVNIGGEALLQIVCGAPNVAVGQKVLVATEGSKLYPKSGGVIDIKKSKIRGEYSEGMICAEDELGLGDDHSGIMILDDQTPVGQPAAEILAVRSDVIFEIGLTPNRADATNHLGVAKDLLAWYRVHRKDPQSLRWPAVCSLEKASGHLPLALEVRNAEACPRYSGICMSGIKVGPSPQWLQQAICAMGLKPFNNVVDITNFVMFEMGQPLHAFDYDKISGRKVIVTTLAPDTSFTTLDGVERKLSGDDLMICDGKGRPLCMAGVLGGMETGITQQTTSIFLESAHFKASGIRKSSMRHMIRTHAAKCFEKGSDPNITVRALERAVFLLQEYAGGQVASPLYDLYPKEIDKAKILINSADVIQLAGLKINAHELKEILLALDCEVIDLQNGQMEVFVPTNKPDVLNPTDLVEEVSRVYGFDRIPVPEKIQLSFPKNLPNDYMQRKELRDSLTAKGMREIVNLSLVRSKVCLESGAFSSEDLVYIHNTSNVQLDCMRPTLLFGGLESIQFNQNRQSSDLAFLEFGKTFFRKNGAIIEKTRLGIWLYGLKHFKHWSQPKEEKFNFYDLKAWVQACMEHQRIYGYRTSTMETDNLWAYGLEYSKDGKVLARLGPVSDSLLKMYDLKQEVWYAEMEWDHMQKLRLPHRPFEDMSKFPPVVRDLAFLIRREISYARVEKAISEIASNQLKSIRLFDVYEPPEQVGKGLKSMALSFHIESLDHSMTGKELHELMEQIAQKLEKDLNAQIRR